MLFGTLVENGAGLIHAFNERVATSMKSSGRAMPNWLRPAVAVVLLTVAAALSRIGIIDLIGRGYGTITWAFVLLLMVPLLTVGAFKVFRARGEQVPSSEAAAD